MTNEEIRFLIIRKAIQNMKEFGYENVTTENILTDEVYKLYFKSMLDENVGQGGNQVNIVITELLKEVSL